MHGATHSGWRHKPPEISGSTRDTNLCQRMDGCSSMSSKGCGCRHGLLYPIILEFLKIPQYTNCVSFHVRSRVGELPFPDMLARDTCSCACLCRALAYTVRPLLFSILGWADGVILPPTLTQDLSLFSFRDDIRDDRWARCCSPLPHRDSFPFPCTYLWLALRISSLDSLSALPPVVRQPRS